jgi:hypothetical protein
MVKQQYFAAATLILTIFTLAQNATPVISSNLADPDFIRAADGAWNAFATNYKGMHVQVASAPTASGPWTVLPEDALPQVGKWANGIEAPI